MTTNTTAVRTRPATDTDRPFLRQAYAYTRLAELAAVPWTDEQKAAFCGHQFEAQDTDYRRRWPGGRFLVVEVDGERAGRLYLGELPDELRIIDIALLPTFCGRGIGTTLLRDALAEAAARGVKAVLGVEHRNPARRLYERLGFVETGHDQVYARLEWRAVS